MQLKAGMRVRCVRAAPHLVKGREYVIHRSGMGWVAVQDQELNSYLADRFKPIVRVKAPSRVVRDECCNNAVPLRCKGCPYAKPNVATGISAGY